MLLAKIIGRLAFQAAFLVKGPSDQGGPSPLGICLFCDQTDQTVTFFFFLQKAEFNLHGGPSCEHSSDSKRESFSNIKTLQSPD